MPRRSNFGKARVTKNREQPYPHDTMKQRDLLFLNDMIEAFYQSRHPYVFLTVIHARIRHLLHYNRKCQLLQHKQKCRLGIY